MQSIMKTLRSAESVESVCTSLTVCHCLVQMPTGKLCLGTYESTSAYETFGLLLVDSSSLSLNKLQHLEHLNSGHTALPMELQQRQSHWTEPQGTGVAGQVHSAAVP